MNNLVIPQSSVRQPHAYSALRPLLVNYTDKMKINEDITVVFWTDRAGVRLLLFYKIKLEWTQRLPDRQQAIDAALAVAQQCTSRFHARRVG